jgi:hypothetical protein
MEPAPAHVYDFVGELGGLDPAKAVALATKVITLRPQTERVALDFQNVGTVSSGFANAFFLTLAGAAPLQEWKEILILTGLDSHQRHVLARSLQAARHASAQTARS